MQKPVLCVQHPVQEEEAPGDVRHASSQHGGGGKETQGEGTRKEEGALPGVHRGTGCKYRLCYHHGGTGWHWV